MRLIARVLAIGARATPGVLLVLLFCGWVGGRSVEVDGRNAMELGAQGVRSVASSTARMSARAEPGGQRLALAQS